MHQYWLFIDTQKLFWQFGAHSFSTTTGNDNYGFSHYLLQINDYTLLQINNLFRAPKRGG